MLLCAAVITVIVLQSSLSSFLPAPPQPPKRLSKYTYTRAREEEPMPDSVFLSLKKKTETGVVWNTREMSVCGCTSTTPTSVLQSLFFCSVLQYVAMYCSVMRRVAVCGSVLQCVAANHYRHQSPPRPFPPYPFPATPGTARSHVARHRRSRVLALSVIWAVPLCCRCCCGPHCPNCPKLLGVCLFAFIT